MVVLICVSLINTWASFHVLVDHLSIFGEMSISVIFFIFELGHLFFHCWVFRHGLFSVSSHHHLFCLFHFAIYLLWKLGCLCCRVSHSVMLIVSLRCYLSCSPDPCISFKLVVRSKCLINQGIGFFGRNTPWVEVCTGVRKCTASDGFPFVTIIA